MNQVALFGRFTRDPDLRYTQDGKAIVNFSLAVNRYSGEADFFDCVAWEKQAENIANSCHKGHRLLIWGRLQQDRWTDQQTQQNRTAVKIMVTGFSFIEPPPPQQNNQQGPPQHPGYQPGAYPPPVAGPPYFNQQQQPGYPGYIPPAQPPTAGNYPPPVQPPARGSYPLPTQQPAQPGGNPAPGGAAPAGSFQYNLNDVPF